MDKLLKNVLSCMRTKGLLDENEEENKEKLKQLQEKYIQLLQDEEMRQYFDYEIKFNVMVTDVNKIIAEAIKDVL